jgi:hypothetical protein
VFFVIKVTVAGVDVPIPDFTQSNGGTIVPYQCDGSTLKWIVTIPPGQGQPGRTAVMVWRRA